MKMNNSSFAATKPQALSSRAWLYGSCFVASALFHPGCTGTEADNPVSEPAPVDTTSCKGRDEFVPLGYVQEGPDLGEYSQGGPVPAEVRSRTQGLSPLEEIPVWLECIEWNFSEGQLDYQIANFRGGCAIDWTGGARVTSDGQISIELTNESCAVAACGNCLYDLRSNGSLKLTENPASVTVELLRLDCYGDTSSESTWTLPLAESQSGILCQKADLWGAEKSAANTNNNARTDLFAPCGPDATNPDATCADGLTCVEESCVPSCDGDEDCPLDRALQCRDGSCQLPE